MNNTNQNLLGEKIRYFRKRADMSQLDLELSINSSPGMISRIENGVVNPTKETLHRIGNELNISNEEKIYMFTLEDISEQDILRAKEKSKYTLESDYSFAYLLDSKYKMVEMSKGFRNVCSFLGIEVDNLIGNPIELIAFDYRFGIRNIIPKDEFEMIVGPMLATWKEESYLNNEYWFIQLYKELEKCDDFLRIWEYVKNNDIDIYTIGSRKFNINIKGFKIEMIYTSTSLMHDHRFKLITFKPTDPSILSKIVL